MDLWKSYNCKEWFSTFGPNVKNRPLSRSSMDILRRLAGTNEALSAQEIRQAYYPLARVVLDRFRQLKAANPTQDLFILGISGSVAVGKSTGARLLTELLRREVQSVELITSDNFLKPNHQLEAENLLKRKGFPESYDQTVINSFIEDIQQKKTNISIPTYDHIAYTILPDHPQHIPRPKILVLEGVNVLQDQRFPLDYRLYFDAKEPHIKSWYIQRFLTFRNQAFRQPGAYFERFAKLSDQEATDVAANLWETINLINLEQYILPGKNNADCIVHKNKFHKVDHIQLRDSNHRNTTQLDATQNNTTSKPELQ